MYTMKTFAPGKVGWLKLKELTDKGIPQDKINDAMRPYMRKTLNAAKKANAFKMAGRSGLLAASVSAYMDEADENLPQENEPIVKKEEINLQEEAPEQNQATAEQQLGQNIVQQQALMNQLQGTSNTSLLQGNRAPISGRTSQSPVAQGAQIAQNTQSAVGNPALSPSITANSIPNSFANLMGSINMGKG